MVESAASKKGPNVKRNVTDKSTVLEVENTQFNPKIFNKNKSPFVNQKLDWDDADHFQIPEALIKGIKEVHLWEKPSRIQSVAIPYVMRKDDESKNPNKYECLIAQARNGAGKSGAFVIGSLLRVDPTIKKVQVICIGHTRELVNQTTEVYEKVTRLAPDYKICNLLDKYDPTA